MRWIRWARNNRFFLKHTDRLLPSTASTIYKPAIAFNETDMFSPIWRTRFGSSQEYQDLKTMIEDTFAGMREFLGSTESEMPDTTPGTMPPEIAAYNTTINRLQAIVTSQNAQISTLTKKVTELIELLYRKI